VVVTLKYEDGSLCTLTYTSLGSSEYPKEFCQIYFDNKIITIDDYKKINGYGIKIPNVESKCSEKGHYEEFIEFAKAIRNEYKYSIPLWQLSQASEISYLVQQQLMK
jgi:predicted dehydrogenase